MRHLLALFFCLLAFRPVSAGDLKKDHAVQKASEQQAEMIKKTRQLMKIALQVTPERELEQYRTTEKTYVETLTRTYVYAKRGRDYDLKKLKLDYLQYRSACLSVAKTAKISDRTRDDLVKPVNDIGKKMWGIGRRPTANT